MWPNLRKNRDLEFDILKGEEAVRVNDSNSGAKTIYLSKDDESQLTVRVEISCSLWSLDRWTWIRIKMEPQGELQGRSLGNFELSELLPQGCDLDRSSGSQGDGSWENIHLLYGALRSNKTACWSCEGKLKIVQLRNAHHRIDDSEGISEGKDFFLGRKLGESPSFF